MVDRTPHLPAGESVVPFLVERDGSRRGMAQPTGVRGKTCSWILRVGLGSVDLRETVPRAFLVHSFGLAVFVNLWYMNERIKHALVRIHPCAWSSFFRFRFPCPCSRDRPSFLSPSHSFACVCWCAFVSLPLSCTAEHLSHDAGDLPILGRASVHAAVLAHAQVAFFELPIGTLVEAGHHHPIEQVHPVLHLLRGHLQGLFLLLCVHPAPPPRDLPNPALWRLPHATRKPGCRENLPPLEQRGRGVESAPGAADSRGEAMRVAWCGPWRTSSAPRKGSKGSSRKGKDKWRCVGRRSRTWAGPEPEDRGAPPPVETTATTGKLLHVAGVVGTASAAAKMIGMVREMAIASCFGIGAAVDAFSFAFILPGFFAALLGGINGPFHSAVASAMMRTRGRKEKAEIVEKVASISFLALGAISLLTCALAEPLIDLAAPGLVLSGGQGLITRQVAILQLRIMAPSAIFAGMTGIYFGALAASGSFVLPAISPAFSSLSVLACVVAYAASNSQNVFAGGAALAVGILAGSMVQWVVQASLIARRKIGNPLRLRIYDVRHDPVIMEVLAVLAPAVVASGMLQIATYTDLYFASFLPHAAASLGYANLLVMAPLGIVSSSLLVPILPMFAGLVGQEDWEGLAQQLKTALVISVAATLALASVLIPLAEPIVRWVFERKAFDASASAMVIPLLVCYSVGAPLYLVRDVLVRAFYALGSGNTPFVISGAAISANVVLDWLLTKHYHLGAPGLVVATVTCNGASAVCLYRLLAKKVQEVNDVNLARPLVVLLLVAIASSTLTYFFHDFLRPCLSRLALSLMGALSGGRMPSLTIYWMADGASICAAVLVGFLSFLGLARQLGIEEAHLLVRTLGQKAQRIFHGAPLPSAA